MDSYSFDNVEMLDDVVEHLNGDGDCNGKENFTASNQNLSHACKPIEVRNFDTDGSVLTERNIERSPMVAQPNTLYSNDVNVSKMHAENASMRPETIYANSTALERNVGDGLMEYTLNRNAVPCGRKPALPPKPSSQVQSSTMKTKGFLQFGRPASFEKNSTPNKRDPAEMSLKERRALFEKNKGNALLPKTPIGMSKLSIARQMIHETKINGDIDKVPLLPNKSALKTVPIQHKIDLTPLQTQNDCNHETTEVAQPVYSSVVRTENQLKQKPNQDQDTSPVQMRQPKMSNQIGDIIDGHRRQRSSSPKSPPPPPPVTKRKITPPKSDNSGNELIESQAHVDTDAVTSSYKRRSGELVTDTRLQIHDEDVKRAKMTRLLPYAESSLYGDLTPIVTTTAPAKRPDETIGLNELHPTELNSSLLPEQQQPKDDDSFIFEAELSSIDCSLGVDFMSKKHLDDFNDSTQSIADDKSLDKNLDDGASGDESKDEYNLGSVQSKFRKVEDGSVSTDSFCFSKDDEPMKDKTDVQNLTHTVSFYRKQQADTLPNSPIRKICYPTISRNTTLQCDSVLSNDDGEDEKVAEKIKTLTNDISIQQHHMAQASHALNTCAATFEFSGSTESVVAEWKLFVTTHCQKAALNELSRLRTERCIRKPHTPQDCGRLVIGEIVLPLRQDYVSKLATDAICAHHLVCLLKLSDSEQVVATKTIPTLPGLLSVKFPDVLQLKNVYADFRATLEIYGMIAQREILPHDIKYHIKTKKIRKLLTPKSKKTIDSTILIMTPSKSVSSEMRVSNFRHFGSVEITLRESQRTNWPIERAWDESPLNGVVSMKINCELAVKVDHKAFLTMFDDISGFGAWHRRWCHLNGNILNYWKYPDDENKPPIGRIDLSLCKQTRIGVAPRDVCARMNTLSVELRRPAHETDRESLVLAKHGNETIQRHLLSCDTKEERDEWIMHLNKALEVTKAWNLPKFM